VQEFTAPVATSYKIQCWGASGGNSYEDKSYGNYNTVYGGKGGFCSGEVTFLFNLKVYIYVGQSGEGIHLEKTYNGGGAGGINYDAKSGGGATDIRLIKGNTWSEFNSLKSRIIVAAGGGGAQHYTSGSQGGNAGGLFGQDGLYSCILPHPSYTVATGAIQTLGGYGGIGASNGFDGTFGIGGDHEEHDEQDFINKHLSSYTYGGGGGGGYYGGGGGSVNNAIVGSGAGGSSFISGYPGCDAISESSTEDNIIHTGQPNHYSSYVFTNPVMIDGGSTMPSPSGGTETGHSGNGYCIITWQQLPQ